MSNTIFTTAIQQNFTTKNHTAARINGAQIGIENYAKWKSAIDSAYEHFYTYQKKCVDTAISKTEAVAPTTAAMDALGVIIDLIGEVNGFKLRKSVDMLNVVSVAAIRWKEERVGEALTVHSQIKNLETQLDEVAAGMSEEYVQSLETQLAEKKARLEVLDAQPESAQKQKTRASKNTYRYNIERELGAIINEQSMKSWEELEAERAAAKAIAKANRKAKKSAKK
jgi:hypothetical protein